MTTRSIPASSTASSSPARWSWATCTGPTPPTRSCSASVSLVDSMPAVAQHMEERCQMTFSDQAIAALAVAFVAGCRRLRRAGRRAVKKGAGGLRRAEVLDVPLHRRQGRQAEPARRRRARSSRPTKSGMDRRSDRATARSQARPRSRRCRTKYGKLPAADIDALVAYMQSLK